MAMSEHKACFCDGSCKARGICGDRMIGPGLVDKQYHTDILERRITKSPAEELNEIAEKVKYDKEAKARNEAQKVYPQIKDNLRAAAELGAVSYNVDSDELSLDLPFSEVYSFIIEDLELKGFTVSPSNIGFYVRWGE